ncbi:torsin-1B-like [Babylonia areolata]|uniref:torsin-1B-like n=1 Tax=Babylonia areolata TaxID=304850 RepID=UPI003FD148C7
MASKVFGQHIAVDVVPRTIEQYLRAVQDRKKLAENPNACFLPPLVLSFHGWTGVGKNFVSDIITGVFPARTVVKLLVPYHFPHQHLDELYQNQVQRWILSNVTDYSVNFFILDEMDKASLGVTRGIHSAIAKLHERNSCRSPVVFLLLSNSFGTDINKQVFEAMMNKEQRGHLSLSHFSLLFDGSADHDEAWYKRLQSDVTVAVPFLPLEKQHVIQCIRQDLVTKKLSTQADLVRRVLQELQFTRLPSGQEFSQTGCKRVSDKVNLVAFE